MAAQLLIPGKNMQLSMTACVAFNGHLMETGRMVDQDPLRKAVYTAWSIYVTIHPDVDVTDGRQCLLERHLQRRLEASQGGTEELTCSGLAYLDRLPKDEW